MHTLSKVVLVSSLALLSACGPADPCAGGGTATVKVTLRSTITGAKAKLTRPDGSTMEVVSTDVDSTTTLADVPSGQWSVVGERYVTPDARVRTVFEAAADPASFCVASNGTQSVTVTWSPIVTSNKLWALNANGEGRVLGFSAADLLATGTRSAVSKGPGPFGHDITFDKDGNLWSQGGTTADATLVMTLAAHLSGTATKTADRSINIEGIGCGPSTTGMAFDRSGNLWVSSTCAQKIYRITAAQLQQSGNVTPSVVLGGVEDAYGLAFDAMGNLFVAGRGLVARYDASVLGASAAAPSGTIAALRTDISGDTSVLVPSWLAFDSTGRLWADDFGANVFYPLAAADLSGSGARTVTPAVRITVNVGALIEGFAFDESGGLWFGYTGGKLARLDATQLTTSSGSGSPTAPETVLTSSDIGSAANVAFYPAPAGLPLFHALP
ncbi:MAG: hypothetical protein IPJ65_09700 [Archangiaceae bacterium]|nr:hypothetical protein [Archangiaceae bacterium]